MNLSSWFSTVGAAISRPAGKYKATPHNYYEKLGVFVSMTRKRPAFFVIIQLYRAGGRLPPLRQYGISQSFVRLREIPGQNIGRGTAPGVAAAVDDRAAVGRGLRILWVPGLKKGVGPGAEHRAGEQVETALRQIHIAKARRVHVQYKRLWNACQTF